MPLRLPRRSAGVLTVTVTVIVLAGACSTLAADIVTSTPAPEVQAAGTAVRPAVAPARYTVDPDQLATRRVAAAELAPAVVVPEQDPRRALWDRLADCESGDWRGGEPIPDTRRWDYGLGFSHGDQFEGGLNFHPATWDGFRDADMPSHAGRATPAQQIQVAERVLDAQGWGAWPTCSRKLDLRG